MKYKKILKSRGFTLLEIMMASFLMAIGVVSVVRSISTGLRADYSVEGKLTALNLAQQKMVEIKNTVYASITANTTTTEDYDGGITNFNNYKRVLTIAADNTNADSKSVYKKATVTVYWKMKGVEQSVTLVTYIANLSPYS